MNLQSLFLQHGARAWEKQMFLSRLLGDTQRWFYSMETGSITFDEMMQFAIQFLGTESAASNTWLWAWANEASNIPHKLVEAAHRLKQYGETHQVPILTNAEAIALDDDINGQRLALIASGILKANASYRAPYEGGAVFLLIQDESFPEDERPVIERMATSFPNFIQNMQVFDHIKALRHYMDSHQLKIEAEREGRILIGTAPDETRIQATFDAKKRLTQLTTMLKAE